MPQPLMPKATAVWLVENTTLTFKQIADYCGLHELEIQAIADGEVAPGMHGIDPTSSGQLTQAEVERCQEDPNAKLAFAKTDIPLPKARTRGARYTPVAKRNDKPDAIEWLTKHYPELADAQIGRILGTTKPTIKAVRERTHWNSQNIRPRSPVELGLCSLTELDGEIIKARRAKQRAEDRKRRAERRAEREAAAAANPQPEAPAAETPTTDAPMEAPVQEPAHDEPTGEAAEYAPTAPATDEPQKH
ncbi:MAG: cell cycle transcriptional regulator TrcR [Alphaproteobacteria bacterium]